MKRQHDDAAHNAGDRIDAQQCLHANHELTQVTHADDEAAVDAWMRLPGIAGSHQMMSQKCSRIRGRRL